jgi:hypothetical protein
MLLFALVLAATAAAPRPFADERELLDRRLAAVRRRIPDGAQPAADAAHVTALAEASLLYRVSVTSRAPAESHGVGVSTLDVAAFGRFTAVETFFRQVAASPRLVDVESVALSGTPDTLRLTAVVHLPFWPASARLPPAPEGVSEHTRGVPKPRADTFLRDQSLLLAKTEALATLRRVRRNPRLFLSELAASVQGRPVVLTEVSWGDELFVVRGLSMGEGPTQALERRLENGYFRVSELLMARVGGCRRFEVRGRSPMAGSAIDLPLAEDDPFRQDELPCRVDRDAPGADAVRASGAKLKTAPGPLTVRAHEIDAADLFAVLHEITGQGFLVDDSLKRRLNVDLAGVTLDETLAALAREHVYVGPPAPLRRVSASPIVPRKDVGPPAPESARVTVAVKRATVRELLGIFAQAEPTAQTSAPDGPLGIVSVWAKDVDVQVLRSAVLDVVGLGDSSAGDGRRVVLRAGAANEPVMPVLPSASPRRLTARPGDLSPDDFDLAALATNGDGAWRAFAYSPAGSLHRYLTGDRLTDGSVRTIEPAGVLLDGDEGPTWVRLP